MKTLITLSLTAIAASASAAVTASDCVSPVSLEYQVTSQGNTKEIAIHRAGREVVREDLTTTLILKSMVLNIRPKTSEEMRIGSGRKYLWQYLRMFVKV